ncbi:MAG: hypothetical protein HYX28_11030 [Candidatus Koribacter versatilis]|uniref:Sulfatase N-terminal domain-containing protein n=1 Tax=Candidatus Korobacter versatilis TaxID=658062 RepID=A0A932EQW6_9BACT|nr:hypothetical protein [Candidatus Koribacter versatilis]
MGRRFLIAISLANLMFFRLWRELLNGKQAYYTKSAPNGNFIGMLVSVTLVALVLWAAAEVVARSGSARVRTVGRWAFLVVVLMTAHWNHLAVELVRRIGWTGLGIWIVLTATALYFLSKFQLRAAHVLATLLVILSPFVLVTFGQMGWWIYRVNARMSFADKPPAALPADASKPRVVWVVFDELDLRQAFLERDASLQLPEFDRLRTESLFAENAYPPHRITEMALPSLLTGKMIAKVEPIGTDDLAIWFEGEQQPRRWSREATTLSAASALDRNVDVVGWYHPYCRVLSGLQRCYWEDISLLFGELHRDPTVAQAVRDQLLDIPNIGWQLRWLKLLPGPEQLEREEDIDDFQRLGPEALSAAADPAAGLVFIHVPVPHPVGIYDRKAGQYSTSDSASYLDNLALADRTLGEMRRAMEANGTWQRTTMIVSADHWFRWDFWRAHSGWSKQDDGAATKLDHRIPFLLKFAAATEGASYALPFNTVLSHELVQAILRGEVKTPADAARWLDAHRGTLGDAAHNRDFPQ